jgi:hypothetical protein
MGASSSTPTATKASGDQSRSPCLWIAQNNCEYLPPEPQSLLHECPRSPLPSAALLPLLSLCRLLAAFHPRPRPLTALVIRAYKHALAGTRCTRPLTRTPASSSSSEAPPPPPSPSQFFRFPGRRYSQPRFALHPPQISPAHSAACNMPHGTLVDFFICVWQLCATSWHVITFGVIVAFTVR